MQDPRLLPAESFTSLLGKSFAARPSWIEPEIIPRGGKVLLGGEAKIGKSFVLLNIARALATGESLFNYEPFTIPQACRVLILEQEIGEKGFKSRVEKGLSDVVSEVLSNNLWYVSKRPWLRFDDAEGFANIRALIEQVQPNVLFCDPLSKFHYWDENHSTDMAKFWNRMDTLVWEYRHLDLAVVISHHYGKPLRDPRIDWDPLDPYNFRGSSKVFDEADTLLTMHRTEQDIRLPWEAWRLKVRWTLRQASSPRDMLLTVNSPQEGRVLFEKFVE